MELTPLGRVVKRKLFLVAATLVIGAGLSAAAAYTIVAALTDHATVWRTVALLGLPVGFALAHGSFSSHRSVHVPQGWVCSRWLEAPSLPAPDQMSKCHS